MLKRRYDGMDEGANKRAVWDANGLSQTRYDPYGSADPYAAPAFPDPYGAPPAQDPYATTFAVSYSQPQPAMFPPRPAKDLRCRHWGMGECKLGEQCKFEHTGEKGDLKRCRHWVRSGECKMGDECKFDHTHGPNDPKRCRHWATRGHCNLGEKCKFGHTGTPGDTKFTPEMRNPRPNYGAPLLNPYFPFPGYVQQPTATSKNPCRHFEKGHCNLGVTCHFAHIPSGGTTAGVRPFPAVKRDSPCRHWLRGHCNMGAACAFVHNEADLGSQPKVETPAATTELPVAQ